MLKLNNIFYKIMGLLALIIVLVNLAIPITGIITGVLFISKNYSILMFVLLTVISVLYMFTVYKILKRILIMIFS